MNPVPRASRRVMRSSWQRNTHALDKIAELTLQLSDAQSARDELKAVSESPTRKVRRLE